LKVQCDGGIEGFELCCGAFEKSFQRGVKNSDSLFSRLPIGAVAVETTRRSPEEKRSSFGRKLELDTLFRGLSNLDNFDVVNCYVPLTQGRIDCLDDGYAVEPDSNVWFYEFDLYLEKREVRLDGFGHGSPDVTLS
jgi:hypothetical protein